MLAEFDVMCLGKDILVPTADWTACVVLTG